MSVSGGIVYVGPSGAATITTPPVNGTVYHWTGTKALYLAVEITAHLAALNDTVTVDLLIGATATPATLFDTLQETAGSAVINTTVEFLHAVVPPGWYFEVTTAITGTATVTINGAVGVT